MIVSRRHRGALQPAGKTPASWRGRLRAIFGKEISIPKSSRLRDFGAAAAIALAVFVCNHDFLSSWLPANDLAGSMAGFQQFKRQWLAEGRLPLWLPPWFAGMVSVHSLSEFFLALPLSFFLPVTQAFRLLGVLAVGAGSVGVFWFLRRFGISRSAAVVGGLTFCLHPLVLVELRFFGHLAFVLTLAILPYYLLSIWRLFAGECQSRVAPALLLALVFSLHPTMGMMVALMTVMLLVFPGWHTVFFRRGLQVGMVFAGAGLFSAFAILPLWAEAQGNLALFAGGQSKVSYPLPSTLFLLDRCGVLLSGFKAVLDTMGNTPLLARYPVSTAGAYLGYSVVAIGGLGVLAAKGCHRTATGPWGCLPLVWAALVWLAMGDTSVLAGIWHMIAAGNVAAALMALVAVVATTAWIWFLARGLASGSQRRRASIRVGLMVIAAILMVPGYPLLRTMVPFFSRLRAPAQFLVPAFAVLPLLVGLATERLAAKLRRGPRLLVPAAAALLLLVDFYPYRDLSLNEVSGFDVPQLGEMGATLEAAAAEERAFYSFAYSPVMDYCLSDLAHNGSVSYWLNWGAPRHFGEYRAALYRTFARWTQGEDATAWKALMAIADVRFIVNPRFKIHLAPDADLKPIFHSIALDVYEYEPRMGRVRLYAEALLSTAPSLAVGELVQAYRTGKALVATEGIYEEQWAEVPTTTRTAATSRSDGAGRIISWHRSDSTNFSAEVSLSRPAILNWAEAYHPGWRVEIDGQPAVLLRVNYAFMGVKVPSGHHKVHFHFQPFPWRLLGSAISLVTGLAVLVVSVRRGRSTPLP